MTFWKEPFVHFALLGVAVFAWFALSNPDDAPPADPDRIVVDQRVVETLSAQFSARMNRAPRADEMQAIVDRYVRDEIMVREALTLGLDQGDGIVRNRMVQKMGFLMTSAAQSAVPDEAELAQHLETHAERFRATPTASFEQFGLAADLSETEVAMILSQLQAGKAPSAGSALALLPPRMDKVEAPRIDGTFGRGFYAQIVALPVGAWAGPVQSGFGLHLVRVTALDPGAVPPLDDIRDAVLFDWRNTLADQLMAAQEAALTARYEVVRPTSEELQSWGAP